MHTKFDEIDILPSEMLNKHARYNRSDKGRARTLKKKREYREARPFIGWDGEGITVPDGRHIYTSFASSTGDYIADDSGLDTGMIFDVLLESKRRNPTAIHVIYGGGYDFNMWCADIPHELVYILYKTGKVFWQNYRLEWRQGKYFRITDRDDGVTITVNDVVSFFQRPFVAACDEYLKEKFYKRDLIVRNKARRGDFLVEDNAEVREYNEAELVNLVLLMNELRKRLANVDLFPARWDGPGAVAVALLKREGVKNAMAISPDHVREAARYAYAGGRFEVIRYGDVAGKAYEYDINSAYPYALQFVPNLARGRWVTEYGSRPGSRFDFAIYEIEWQGWPLDVDKPQPFFCRSPKGNVFYPVACKGWYWAPEVYAAIQTGHKFTIGRVYRFVEDDPQDRPFDFIPPMYRKRQALKKAGDGAHVGIKLGLNSLYGKCCQRVGWELQEDGTVRIPPFHQLEWAGFTTSVCRSLVFEAAMQKPDKVIAFETDALFMSEPLSLTVGAGLGEWEATEFDRLCYTQSGFYFGFSEGKAIDKTRGIDRGSLGYGDVAEIMTYEEQEERIAEASLTRFISVGQSLQLNNWNRWRTWETAPKKIKLFPQGKREHNKRVCINCWNGETLADSWHMTFVPVNASSMLASHQYPIPWENPNPEMTRLDEFNKDRKELMAVDYE